MIVLRVYLLDVRQIERTTEPALKLVMVRHDHSETAGKSNYYGTKMEFPDNRCRMKSIQCIGWIKTKNNL